MKNNETIKNFKAVEFMREQRDRFCSCSHGPPWEYNIGRSCVRKPVIETTSHLPTSNTKTKTQPNPAP